MAFTILAEFCRCGIGYHSPEPREGARKVRQLNLGLVRVFWFSGLMSTIVDEFAEGLMRDAEAVIAAHMAGELEDEPTVQAPAVLH
ncbi:hypothetical protein M0638_07040 [Roseomonas sp. NAR14]|uniref:Uncharacterized protein n=1 Tax=Roseomonas acroporae TaxID=2937791 RepID=A0A9X1Y8D3_9PROT|nr:hypothetical protein [Roseomonas acroporae]MCK8784130.1 hypothetical protein [Roseomonas acroporae]